MRAFPIHDDADHARAVDLVDQLWDARSGSPEADLRDVMAELIERFEARGLSQLLPPPDPRAVIDARRRELRLSQRQLGERLGWRSSGRVSEVLSGKRQLTLDMVRDLERVLGIEPGLLVADRSPSADGDVWVRLPAELVTAAQGAAFAGCDGLDAMVREAVAGLLRSAPPAGAAATEARVWEGPGDRGAGRAPLTLTSVRRVA
jgi:HTH-type transcriptional regulator/antitoxin HigA